MCTSEVEARVLQNLFAVFLMLVFIASHDSNEITENAENVGHHNAMQSLSHMKAIISNMLIEPRQANLCLRAVRHDKF